MIKVMPLDTTEPKTLHIAPHKKRRARGVLAILDCVFLMMAINVNPLQLKQYALPLAHHHRDYGHGTCVGIHTNYPVALLLP